MFTNLLLADEINRTPPKTQASLLEAMEERQVTVDGDAAPAARPVPRHRDPEPGRVRGHLPAARGPARPLPAQAHDAAARRATRRSRCSPGTRQGFDPRDLRRRRASGRWPAPPTSRRGRAAVRAVAVAPEVHRLHRRPRAARPARRRPLQLGVSPRGATALLRTRPGVGVAVGPRLRHPGRRQGAGPPDAAPPGPAARRGRARGRHRRRRARHRARSVPVPR